MIRLSVIFFSLFVGLAALAECAAVIEERAATIEERTGSASLTWTGSVFPRSEPISLSGTMDEIHAEVLRRNPAYNADEVDGLQSRADLLPRAIDFAAGKTDCKANAQVSLPGANGVAHELMGLGGDCKVEAKTCARMRCRSTGSGSGNNNIAAWLCSETDKPVTIPCKEAGAVLEKMVSKCTCAYENPSKLSNGRWDSADKTFSLWVGWSKCHGGDQYLMPLGSNDQKFKELCAP